METFQVLETKAAVILQLREAAKQANRIAHTPNTEGLVTVRSTCTCYTCRTFFDPTGLLDAAIAIHGHGPRTSAEYANLQSVTLIVPASKE